MKFPKFPEFPKFPDFPAMPNFPPSTPERDFWERCVLACIASPKVYDVGTYADYCLKLWREKWLELPPATPEDPKNV